jgi:tetratricopeptide (TPR) repeat protein
MSDEGLVNELLSAWERGLAEGRDIPATQLCRDRPDLAPELELRIQAVRRLNHLAAVAAGAGGSSFDQIVSVCEAFTRVWGRTSKPSLDAYLAQVGPDDQPALLRNLLTIDMEQRRAAGERPRIDDYLDRLPPQFANLVREMFLAPLTPDTTVWHGSESSAPVARSHAANRLGNYELLRELGRGGMGVVYEARHVRGGARVALKTLPAVDGASLHRFKREFRALAEINHPNLVGLHTLEADGCHWFFTMDLIEGEDFLTHVRPGGALDESRLRAALAQLVIGVMALHSHHAVHRDLKPSNVIVTHNSRVVLLDFGLIAELDRPGASGTADRLLGTPAYMAPEQAAGDTVTAASDWYAVGTMLYQALAGRLPFTGPGLKVLQDKQSLDAPPLPDDSTVPRDLSELCLGLLRREARRRPDVLAIARVVSAGLATQPAGRVRGQALVGREPHLAALTEALHGLERRSAPQTVFVSGRSGEGKTVLVEHFLGPLRRDSRLAVMSGRCYDRESVPFKALDTLIDALAGYLRSLPETDAALLMPDDIGVLARVFPVLQRVGVVARASAARLSALDEQQVRQRAFLALRSLLTRIARRSPVVWFIDDLQWGDADSAEALFEVLRPPEAPSVLFLGSYRSDETQGSAFLKKWQELQHRHGVRFAAREVKLAPLSTEECVGLVIGLVERDDEAIRRRAAEFARETRGNPFLLTELVGCFDPDADSFQPTPLDAVLARKLGRLPAEAAPLLEAVAVSGQPLPLEEAARAAGHDRPPVPTFLQMRKERLVRLIGPDDSPLVDTYHDRVRETVLEGMDGARRKALHLRLGEVIESAVGGVSPEQAAALESGSQGEAVPRAHDLAYHYDAAGERRKAWVYALLAAEQARRQFALGVAVEQYAVARRNAAEAPATLRCRLAVGCGEALMIPGRYDEATAELEAAAQLTDDPVARATIEGYQGEIALKRGRAGQGAALCERALRRLGEWIPRSRLGWAWALIREPLVHWFHRLFPGRLHRAASSARSDLTSRLYGRTAYAYFMSNSSKAMWGIQAAMNQGERFPPSPALAFGYAGYAITLMMLGRSARALHYVDRSIALSRELNDQSGIANSLLAHGSLLYASARYKEGIAKLDEAIELYRRADLFDINAALLHWGLCQDKLGNLSAIIELSQTVFAKDVPHGDDNSGHFSLFGYSLGTRGNLPFEELRACLRPLPDNVVATSLLLLGEGYWHWFHSRTGEALRVFESAWQMVKTNAALNHLTVATLPWLVTALRRHADTLESDDARQCHRLRKRAFRLAKWAARLTRFFPPHYPHSLLELSHAYTARGRLKKALGLAEKSCAVAEGQSAKYEHAESLLLRGQLERQLGLPQADEHIRTAEAVLAARDEAILQAIRRPAAGWPPRGAAPDPNQEGRD